MPALRQAAPADAGPQLTLFEPAAPETPARPAAPHRLFQHPRSNRRIQLGEHSVGYELRRAQRRSIGFVVGDEGLSVAAPRWVGQGDIDEALQTKARWILRKLVDQGERLNRLAAARVDWRDGAELPYLGEPLRIVLDARVDGARFDETARLLQIGLSADAAPTQIRDAVQSWLQRQALQRFAERCAHFAQRLGVRVRQIRLSSAQTRWGSATSNGTIRLHWRLMHFAPSTIDYVVAHELAHLREMNHSPAFWDVVRSVMPDFEAARGALQHHALPVFD
jgi:predicted metal-dependent hydrolase